MLCFKKLCFITKTTYRPVYTKSEAENQSELLSLHLHTVSLQRWIDKEQSTHQRKIAIFQCQINWFNMNKSKSYALFIFKIFFALNIHENISLV